MQKLSGVRFHSKHVALAVGRLARKEAQTSSVSRHCDSEYLLALEMSPSKECEYTDDLQIRI